MINTNFKSINSMETTTFILFENNIPCMSFRNIHDGLIILKKLYETTIKLQQLCATYYGEKSSLIYQLHVSGFSSDHFDSSFLECAYHDVYEIIDNNMTKKSLVSNTSNTINTINTINTMYGHQSEPKLTDPELKTKTSDVTHTMNNNVIDCMKYSEKPKKINYIEKSSKTNDTYKDIDLFMTEMKKYDSYQKIKDMHDDMFEHKIIEANDIEDIDDVDDVDDIDENDEREIDASIERLKMKIEKAHERKNTSEYLLSSDDNSDDDNYDDSNDDENDTDIELYENKKKMLNEEFMKKANDMIKQEIFLKRCQEQEMKKEKERYEERISVLKADKNVFLKIHSQIKEGLRKVDNLPPLFNHKYHIINFMMMNELITLNNNDSIELESNIFHELYKIIKNIEAYEDHKNNTKNKNNEEYDVLCDIDDDYLEICNFFIEYLNDNEGIVSDNMINKMLNDDHEIKKHIFANPENQDIFTNDFDKEEFMNK